MRKCPSSRSGSALFGQGKRRSRRRTAAQAAWAIGDPLESAARLRIAPCRGVLGSGCFSFLWFALFPRCARRIEARLQGAGASAQRAALAFPLRLGSAWPSGGIGRGASRRETRARRSQAALSVALNSWGAAGMGRGGSGNSGSMACRGKSGAAGSASWGCSLQQAIRARQGRRQGACGAERSGKK